jgi:transcriptional regulator with XRE-family HTH domain
MELHIGQRIRALRLSRGMTQGHLAERAGLNEKHLGVLEREGKDLAVSTLVRIAGALDVPVGELFTEPTKDDKAVVQRRVSEVLASGDDGAIRRLRLFLDEILFG